jgi:hypothetical protein
MKLSFCQPGLSLADIFFSRKGRRGAEAQRYWLVAERSRSPATRLVKENPEQQMCANQKATRKERNYEPGARISTNQSTNIFNHHHRQANAPQFTHPLIH